MFSQAIKGFIKKSESTPSMTMTGCFKHILFKAYLLTVIPNNFRFKSNISLAYVCYINLPEVKISLTPNPYN